MEPGEKKGFDFAAAEARLEAAKGAVVVVDFNHTCRAARSLDLYSAKLRTDAEELQRSLRNLGEAGNKVVKAMRNFEKMRMYALLYGSETKIGDEVVHPSRLKLLENQLEIHEASTRTMQPAEAKPKNLRPGPAVKGKKGKVRKW